MVIGRLIRLQRARTSRSAEPSSPGGVPTAIKAAAEPLMASERSVESAIGPSQSCAERCLQVPVRRWGECRSLGRQSSSDQYLHRLPRYPRPKDMRLLLDPRSPYQLL